MPLAELDFSLVGAVGKPIAEGAGHGLHDLEPVAADALGFRREIRDTAGVEGGRPIDITQGDAPAVCRQSQSDRQIGLGSETVIHRVGKQLFDGKMNTLDGNWRNSDDGRPGIHGCQEAGQFRQARGNGNFRRMSNHASRIPGGDFMIRSHCLLAVVLATAAVAVHAGEYAGRVKSSRGDVTIERSGTRIPAPVGTTVEVNDQVRTGRDGSVGLTLRDNTLLSAGPNALLILDRFAFDTTTHAGELEATVQRGTVAVVSGKLAKESPESVRFRTPTSILGVRGTEFIIEVIGRPEE